MAEELKELIEKIQEEGVKAAEDKAKDIEDRAKSQAGSIIDEARKEAADIIATAKNRVGKMEVSHKASLKQAARNLKIGLRKEINSMLNSIVRMRVREALGPKELSKILNTLIKDYSGKEKADIVISLDKDDLKKIQEGFLSELKKELKKKIVLKGAEDIRGGFVISYDGGKSHFDFTDKALAEYIVSFVNPKLGDLLKETP